MPNRILTMTSAGTFTITLASLANSAARQSDVITNVGMFPAAIVYVTLTSGSVAPTAATTYDVYLGRGNLASGSTYRSENAGASDATISIENPKYIGAIILTNTTNKAFYGEFDTSPAGPLGPEWFIIICNSSGQTLNGTAGNHSVTYNYYYPEVQ